MPDSTPRPAALTPDPDPLREAQLPPRPRVRAGQLLAGLGLLALVALAIVRVAVQDRTPLGQLGVHDLRFAAVLVGRGQTLTRELSWVPERDVYVLGWNPALQAPPEAGYQAELTLFDAATRISVMVERRSPPGGAAPWSPAELPSGTGYRVRAGRTLTLRFRIVNDGAADFWTQAAGAQIRFVPAG